MLLSVVFYMLVFVVSGCAKAPPAARALPDFAATSVAGDATSALNRGALSGRVWIVDFVYTTCAGPCPLLSAHMESLQKRLPASVGLLSFTVDPDHDSPAVLARYARRFHADPRRWLFATGGKAALMTLYRDGFLIPVVESAAAAPGQNVAHTTKFVLLDRRARIVGYYDGDDPAALDRLAADAERL